MYYAASWRCYFAVVEVRSDEPDELDDELRWPYALDVTGRLLVPRLSIAPSLSDLSLRKGNLSVRHQSHVSLTRAQYDSAVAGLAAVAISA